MAGKSDMLNATDYTSKLKSLFFSMSRFAAGLYKSLEDLGVTDKSIHLTQERCWIAMYFILPDDLKLKVDEAVKDALREYEEKKRDHG